MVAALTASSGSHADTPSCGQTDATWVNVRFLGRGWTKKTADGVMAELKTDLAKDGIAICAEVPSALMPPVAVVELVADEPTTVVISIQVRDKVTAKRVGRDTDVGALPLDGRPLALAAAADELLRVTWAEIALRNARQPAMEAPAPVLRAARATVAASAAGAERTRRASAFPELGGRLIVERYTGGQTLGGADLFLRVGLVSRVALELAAGARAGTSVAAPHGSIRSHALSASAALMTSVFTAGPWDLSAGAGVHSASVTFAAEPSAGAALGREGASANALVVSPYAFAGASVRVLSTLRLGAELGAGAALHGAAATDDAASVTGATGVQVFGGATVGIGL
jgi:hypothetical protein